MAIIVIASFFTVIVAGLLIFCAWRFRWCSSAKDKDERSINDEKKAEIRNKNQLEMMMQMMQMN